MTSHFTSTLPPSYQQQYAYEEEDYDGSEQLHSGSYIEHSLNHPVVPYIPPHQSGLVKHYLDHVLKRQYLLADSSIAAFIIRTVQQNPAVRDAVCLLASLHQESLRRGNPSTAQPNALALHDEPSSDSSKAYKRICESLYSSTQGNYTEGEAMAGLFVVSAFLFRGGRGAWQHFLAVATEWVWNVLNTGADPAETILRCSDSQQFVIKTTFWFDILASTTRLEPPRFLIFYRKLWSSSERGAYIEGTTTTNPGGGGATTASGHHHHAPSPLSMISVMGCENKTALAIAETSALACWKVAHERQGRLSVPDLVDRGRKIEKDCLAHVTPPPSSMQAPPPGGVYYPAGGGIPDELSEKRRLTADIFRSTARVYLHSVISGENPGCPEIRDGVRETIDCLRRVPAGGVGGSSSNGSGNGGTSVARSVLRSVVFGICLCGCLADDPKDREFLLRRLNAEEQAEGVGNCTSAFLVMQEVWRRRAPCIINNNNGAGGGNGGTTSGGAACCGDSTASSSTLPSSPTLSWREATQQFGGESLLLV
jgi:C6 transcription factor Pro1